MLRLALVGVGCALACGGARADEKAELDKLAKDIRAKDANVRLRAIVAAGEKGAKAKGLARELCDAVLDKNAKCAAAAVLALETVRPDLYKPVVKMAVDPDGDVKAEGVRQLAALGDAGQPAIRVLHELIKTHLADKPDVGSDKLPGVGYAALRALKATDPETITLLKTLATREGLSTYLGATATRVTPAVDYHRQVAIELLADWAGRDEERRKSLLPIIRSGFDNNVTVLDAVRLAGAYGRLSKDLVPALKRLKVSETAEVREAAGRAIEAIEEQVKK
jgi:hypothetical protein